MKRVAENRPISWRFARPDDPLAELLASRDWQGEGTIVKRNYRRTVYRLDAGAAGQGVVYIKHDHPKSPRNCIKSLWRCKAQREYLAGHQLSAAGVPVVEFLGWGKRGVESFVVTREMPTAGTFLDVWRDCAEQLELRSEFLGRLADFLGVLLRAGVSHPDLHAGNVLVSRRGRQIRFHLVDVFGVRTGQGLTPGLRRRILHLAAGFAHALAEEEAVALLQRTGGWPRDVDAAAEWRDLVRGFCRDMHRRWRGRRLRLLKQSSLCSRHETSNGTWLLRRPVELGVAEAAVAQHETNFAIGRNIVKCDRRRQLSRVCVDGRQYIVKEFRRPRRLPAGLRPDGRSWLNTYRLEMAQLPVARCWGWLRSCDGRGYLVLDDLGDQTLIDTLQTGGTQAERREVLSAAGRLAAWLHDAGVVHGDLNSSNFMVNREWGYPQMPLVLVDSDRIHVRRWDVSIRSRQRNLLQTLDLVRLAATRRECLRFLASYRRTSGIARSTFSPVVRAFLHTDHPRPLPSGHVETAETH